MKKESGGSRIQWRIYLFFHWAVYWQLVLYHDGEWWLGRFPSESILLTSISYIDQVTRPDLYSPTQIRWRLPLTPVELIRQNDSTTY